ncbi:MAG: TonB-dependent receptor [Flavobacteriales bacterium]|nr:TonB-dependent receptor [Flavobacteriales bacterium]
MFFDRSALYHGMGEYRFKPSFAEITVGGSGRMYRPNTAGTIFKDTADVVITNWEVGGYVGVEKKVLGEKLRVAATLRVDKNENFKEQYSPAISAVWMPKPEHVIRISASRAVRNPTLADQYLYYNVGRAILLGNIEGQFEEGNDSLITLESFNDYRNTPSLLEGLPKLDYFNVDRIRPEKVITLETGYRGTLWEKFYLDLSAYTSWYTDFIGYLIGIDGSFDEGNGFRSPLQVYRVAANSTQEVRTQGREHRVELLPPEDHLQRELQLQPTGFRGGRSDHPRVQYTAEQVQYRLHRARHAYPVDRQTGSGLRHQLQIRGGVCLRRLAAVHRPDPEL